MPVLVALVGGRQPSGLCPGHDVAIIVRVALIRSFLFLHPLPELHEAYADWMDVDSAYACRCPGRVLLL